MNAPDTYTIAHPHPQQPPYLNVWRDLSSEQVEDATSDIEIGQDPRFGCDEAVRHDHTVFANVAMNLAAEFGKLTGDNLGDHARLADWARTFRCRWTLATFGNWGTDGTAGRACP